MFWTQNKSLPRIKIRPGEVLEWQLKERTIRNNTKQPAETICDRFSFLQHWCRENKAKHQFEDKHVRQYYAFAKLQSVKQSKAKIWSSKCATVLRFCNTDVWKTKQIHCFKHTHTYTLYMCMCQGGQIRDFNRIPIKNV